MLPSLANVGQNRGPYLGSVLPCVVCLVQVYLASLPYLAQNMPRGRCDLRHLGRVRSKAGKGLEPGEPMGETLCAPSSCGCFLHWLVGQLLRSQLMLKALVAPAWLWRRRLGRAMPQEGACTLWQAGWLD